MCDTKNAKIHIWIVFISVAVFSEPTPDKYQHKIQKHSNLVREHSHSREKLIRLIQKTVGFISFYIWCTWVWQRVISFVKKTNALVKCFASIMKINPRKSCHRCVMKFPGNVSENAWQPFEIRKLWIFSAFFHLLSKTIPIRLCMKFNFVNVSPKNQAYRNKDEYQALINEQLVKSFAIIIECFIWILLLFSFLTWCVCLLCSYLKSACWSFIHWH